MNEEFSKVNKYAELYLKNIENLKAQLEDEDLLILENSHHESEEFAALIEKYKNRNIEL